ncbi:patanin-like phospholipase domain-containing protein atgl-1 [Argiope bruennichi]|uniref:patanin-like phospholipase domain-containing protein atgl-1 n=1 Tax=Argiope bruennichi TaxID=94029 RepID=UPI00249501EC|nr:patanin-like phospholipase domain-containing protein atgl-1 [Argiope bruennichi]
MGRARRNDSLPIDSSQMNLSLNGCGYLGIYHVGVCSCIRKYYPQSLRNKISGGSVGALVACAFMCDVPLDICAKAVFDVSMKVRNGVLGPMSPDLNIMKVLYDKMDWMLPQDAHLHCDGRLYVSVTRYDNGKNVLLNRFKTREELLQALMCSCFIPIYCGYEPPEFYGVAYVDAALSNNSPWINQYTVSVAPFSGNSDICPENDGLFLKSLTLSNTSIGLTASNMFMLLRVLFPASPDIQKDICERGYNDALRFLRDNDLLPCSNCIATNINLGHINCQLPEDEVPPELFLEIEKAILDYKKNLGYKIMQYRSMKMLYYLNWPNIMTAKVGYVLISSILQAVQGRANFSVDGIWNVFLKLLRRGYYGCRDLQSNANSGSLETINYTSRVTSKSISANDSDYSSGPPSGDETMSGSNTPEESSEDESDESSEGCPEESSLNGREEDNENSSKQSEDRLDKGYDCYGIGNTIFNMHQNCNSVLMDYNSFHKLTVQN